MPTPCTVTGNLQNLSSGAIGEGLIEFTLTNLGIGNPIRVIGTSLFPDLEFTVVSAEDGSFTTQLWGNDNIDPANIVYSVLFKDKYGNQMGPVLYSITGVSVNLDSLAATSNVVPPVLFSIPNSTRFYVGGTLLVPGDFILTGWGAGAVVSVVHGADAAHRLTITAGTGPSSSPTFQLNFKDGPWLFAPVILANMVGGTGVASDLVVVSLAALYDITYIGLPTAGSTYSFDIICMGVLN